MILFLALISVCVYGVVVLIRTASPDPFTTPSDPYDVLSPSDAIYERVTPSAELTNKLLAVTTAGVGETHGAIRDASVRGFLYVAEVDEGRRRVKLLSPMPGGVVLGKTVLVVGRWPEDVASLVG